MLEVTPEPLMIICPANLKLNNGGGVGVGRAPLFLDSGFFSFFLGILPF